MLGFIKYVSAIILICILLYTQRYITKDNITAERGIWFTNTIELSMYRKIGTGSGVFGKYDSYSRSDRHETTSVYKD